MIEIKTPILIKTELLDPNPWNPNKVAKPEMELLELSIKKSGFCFPLIVIENNGRFMIVDGFHRHLLAKKLNMPLVPVVVLDEPMSELMAATIRFNRAKGTHQIDQMSNIVADMLQMGVADADVSKNLGMDADEVLRLKQNTGIAAIFKDHEYSKAWE
ncbi:chromosome partitioning protein ParB [bacterium]|nr:chromosome partitioning protein ParB [bacterium]